MKSPVENRFFGETVTVSRLLTGRDLAWALMGKTADEVRRQTGLAIRQAGYDGEALLRALAGAEEAI
jgi:hypothetical protein